METIRELRNKYQTSQEQLEKTSSLNKQLNEIVDELKYQLDNIKDRYNRNLDDKSLRIESYEEKIKDLELELSRSNSKMDEFNLQYTEMKTNYGNQYKLVTKVFIYFSFLHDNLVFVLD
jgi:predicted RNase H-like nuclease (RuvC/YqgF family)